MALLKKTDPRMKKLVAYAKQKLGASRVSKIEEFSPGCFAANGLKSEKRTEGKKGGFYHCGYIKFTAEEAGL